MQNGFQKSLFRLPKEPILDSERAYFASRKSLFGNAKEPLLDRRGVVIALSAKVHNKFE